MTCNVTDRDNDSLSFVWEADSGEISGSGASVQWLAPLEGGFYWVYVEVSDGKADAVLDSIEIAVNNGFLLAQTHDGLMKVGLDGTKNLFYQNSGQVEVLGERIFVGPSGNILELDLEGNMVRTITRASQIPWATTFVVLPDAGFAFVQNNNDSIYFMGPNGEFLYSSAIVETSPATLQSTKGLVVGDTLFMADTDAYGVLAYYLSTYEGSKFRDFSTQSVRPTDIDWYDGHFFICCMDQKIRRLGQGSDLETIATLPSAHLCALAIVGSYAYTVINSAGALYKVNLETGEYVILARGLNYPQDVEFVRVSP